MKENNIYKEISKLSTEIINICDNIINSKKLTDLILVHDKLLNLLEFTNLNTLDLRIKKAILGLKSKFFSNIEKNKFFHIYNKITKGASTDFFMTINSSYNIEYEKYLFDVITNIKIIVLDLNKFNLLK